MRDEIGSKMSTDDERRRAAASLRKIRSGWASGTCYYAIINALSYPDTSREDGGHALYSLLADLIEPSCDYDTPQKVAEEMFGKMRHSTKEERDEYTSMLENMSIELHPVDREALLALADEMESLCGPWSDCGKHYAPLVREALGVVE